MRTEGNPPLRRARESVEAAVTNERRDERADSEHKLLERGKPSSNAWVGNLRLVERGKHREHAYTHSGKEPPAVHIVDVLSAGLNPTSK